MALLWALQAPRQVRDPLGPRWWQRLGPSRWSLRLLPLLLLFHFQLRCRTFFLPLPSKFPWFWVDFPSRLCTITRTVFFSFLVLTYSDLVRLSRISQFYFFFFSNLLGSFSGISFSNYRVKLFWNYLALVFISHLHMLGLIPLPRQSLNSGSFSNLNFALNAGF